jgi:hypothetical protein
VLLEGLVQLKNQMTSSSIEPATFRLVTVEPQPTTLLRALIKLQVSKSLYTPVNDTWFYIPGVALEQ